jgi:hypothetical protein
MFPLIQVFLVFYIHFSIHLTNIEFDCKQYTLTNIPDNLSPITLGFFFEYHKIGQKNLKKAMLLIIYSSSVCR